ncbi:MAG: Na+/H+ antiporter NhaC family protein [Lentimonas sp.]
MAVQKSRGHWLVVPVILVGLGLSVYFSDTASMWRSLLPSAIALAIVFVGRSAFLGLLSGACCGAVLIAGPQPVEAIQQLAVEQLLPIFNSSWKLSAILFTLILGGFVALVEKGGGLQGLVLKTLGTGQAPHKRMQITVFGFGLLVFFDGLANTMLIGRLLRSAADRCGVSREKLAYLADTTGSAVACLAFISTWIAFQLSMIQQGFELAGREVSAYGYFFKSLGTNYYCWFALGLAMICVLRGFNPGSMGIAEAAARKRNVDSDPVPECVKSSHWGLAIIPIGVLTLSIPLLSYWIGSEALFPFSLSKFAESYGRAEDHVPQILVASSILAAVVAGLTFKLSRKSTTSGVEIEGVTTVFMSGVREIAGPVMILLAAWMLGASISQLGTADWLAESLQGRLPVALLPAAIFILGAAISFSTGTSWGTMGVLMPLAIPVIFGLTEGSSDAERDRFVIAAIGAVFSGAVFGDHCSPFSDTTIVASIASGVEPMDHVRTQLPFALIAAAVALLIGFLPLGYGAPALLCLIIGFFALLTLPWLMGRFRT